MPRASNFSYQNPMADIGGSLARAIFGDPQAAAEQAKARAEAELRAAQAEAARASAGYDISRTTGQNTANTAQAGAPDRYRQLFGVPPPGAIQQPTMAVPEQMFAAPEISEAPMRAPAPEPLAGGLDRASMADLFGMFAQMQGDKIDTSETLGSLLAVIGGDEAARRGLVAQGQTPGATFALTPERADEIATNKTDAALRQALGVATINNRDDVPVANVQAGASRYGADARAGASRYGADVGARSRETVAVARAAAARATAERKQAERVARARARPPSVAAVRKLDQAVAEQLEARGLLSLPLEDGSRVINRLDPGVNTWIRTRAIEEFRETGNVVGAATKAINAALAASKRQKAVRAQPSARSPAPRRRPVTVVRTEAMEAIASGAPPAEVAKRFAEMTGQAL